MWNFKRGEGAPTEGLWFRSAIHGDFGPWMEPDDFFGDADWAMSEAEDLDVANEPSDEIALFLTERAIGSRTEDEERPERFVIDAAYNGVPVLTAVSNIEWDGAPTDDGDVSPYASPWSSEIDRAGLKEGAAWWMAWRSRESMGYDA